MDCALRVVPGEVPRAGERDRSDAATRLAGGVGSQPPRLPGGCEGHRRPGGLGQGAQRARAEHSLVPRRLGGPRAVEQDDPDVRGRGKLPGREPRRVFASAAGVARGAYVLADPQSGNPEVLLIASGSEVSLAVEAHEKLLAEGIRSRVVSMPSWEIFDQQAQEYRDSVLPPAVKARVAVEQASTFGWERYVGSAGRVIGMTTFGASAPLKALQKKFGFEPDRIVAAARQLLGRQ